jgi:hypothetical protein
VHHTQRAAARNRILDWLDERGHKVVASGLVYTRLDAARAACPGLAGFRARVTATVHTALAIQRSSFATSASGRRRNASLLFYDYQGDDQTRVARAIANPPEWALELVGDRTVGNELSAIVDTAYFVDSVQAPLIQLADFVAYMIQRKTALDEEATPAFANEGPVINDVFERLSPLLLPRVHRLPEDRKLRRLGRCAPKRASESNARASWHRGLRWRCWPAGGGVQALARVRGRARVLSREPAS